MRRKRGFQLLHEVSSGIVNFLIESTAIIARPSMWARQKKPLHKEYLMNLGHKKEAMAVGNHKEKYEHEFDYENFGH